jgi:hypothetical protein
MKRIQKMEVEKKSQRDLDTLILAIVLALIFIAVEQTWAQTRESRNPFSLPPGVHLATKNTGSGFQEKSVKVDIPSLEPLLAPLKVKAILISDRIRMASIGPYIVTVGDSIEDEKVLQITPDQVVLGKGKKKRTLFLDQSPVRLTVEQK